MNTGWSGILYFCYKNTKILVWTFKIFLYGNYWFYISETYWFIKCSEKHIKSGMPFGCIVLCNPLQEQNHNANCNAEKQTHVKGRWLSCSFEFGLSEFFDLSKLSVVFAIIDKLNSVQQLISLWDILDMMWSAQLEPLHTGDWLYQEANSTLIFKFCIYICI